jgi:hypothetical protein
VAPLVEAPLLDAPPQESSSSRLNWGTRSMNFHNYQGQDYEATSSGHQGGRMSFSGRWYHDSQEAYHHFNNRLTTIEETNATIQGTLYNHT